MRSFHAATGGSTAPGGVVGPSGARILVVEDERVLALDLTETLDELGYTVAGTATRGEEAIELARRLHPHLILMDVGLAGEIDGITAAETIRDEHDVPVVFLTAHADDDTLHRATSTDASAYLVKPFKAPELRCVIEIALHKHAADVRLRENERWLESTLQQRTAALLRGEQIRNRDDHQRPLECAREPMRRCPSPRAARPAHDDGHPALARTRHELVDRGRDLLRQLDAE